MRALRIGSKGHDVSRLQQFLTGRHLYTGVVDGSFGPVTSRAVVAYQTGEKLTPDGVVGSQTWARLIAQGLDVVTDTEQEWPPEPDWLKPLTNNEERMRRWGRFDYRHAPTSSNPEQIEILGDWEDKHIVPVACPVFAREIPLHRDCVADYLGFMRAVIAQDLTRHIRTYDGAFVPRFIRGSKSRLSNHAWGTAFDINMQWNGLGQTPAYRGKPGSVRELVPLANRHNWFWGGHFKSRRDGMHFEHV